MSLSDEILETKKALKLYRPKLARRLGVNPWSLKNWELGRRNPPDLVREAVIRKLRRLRKKGARA